MTHPYLYMSEIRDIATSFEAVKIGIRHTKDGIVLSLAIHPSDMPHDLVVDQLGQRYQVALVRIDTDDQPIASPAQAEATQAMRLMGALCGNDMFRDWLLDNGLADGVTSDDAVVGVKQYLEIESRKELKDNKTARDKLFGLRDEFQDYIRSQTRMRTR